MAYDVRDIAGRTSIPIINQWWWIVEGDAGVTYELRQQTSDAEELCPAPPTTPNEMQFVDPRDHDVYLTTDAGNASGVSILSRTDISARVYQDMVMHVSGNNGVKSDTPNPFCGFSSRLPPVTNRLSGAFTFSVTSPFSQATAYITAGALAATPGDAEVDLVWDAADTIIVETGHLVYQLYRSTGGSPLSGDLIYSGTDLDFADTDVVNGITYRYAVKVEFALDDYPEGLVGNDGVFDANTSNVAEATATAGIVGTVTLAANAHFPRT